MILKKMTKVLTVSMLMIALLMTSVMAFAGTPTWEEEANMLDGKDQMLTATVNGEIYVLGGIGAKGYLVGVQAYDPLTKTWVNKADMPTVRQGATAAVVDEKIYVIGGSVDYKVTGLVEVYDTKTDTWSTVSSMPTERTNVHSAVIGKNIYVVGGRNIYSAQANQAEAYDVVTDTWTSIKPCVGTIDKTLLTSTDTNIYTVNISLWIADNMDAHVVGRYEFGSDDWVPINRRLYDQGKDKFYTEGLIKNEFIPAFGTCHASSNGVLYYLNDQNEIVSYDSKNNTFAKVTTLPFDKTAGSSMAIVDGKMYVLGGFSYDERKSIDKVMSFPIND